MTWDDFQKVAGPTATIIASCVAALFAWRQGQVSLQQKEIAAEKLRLDLFERRYEVFQSIFRYYDALLGWTGTEEDKAASVRFFQAYQQTKFLFGTEVEKIFHELWKAGGEVIGFKKHGHEYVADPAFFLKQFDKTQTILLGVFADRLAELTDACKPYMDFRMVKRDPPAWLRRPVE